MSSFPPACTESAEEPVLVQRDSKGEHPKQLLSLFSGVLQADAYAGFHHLYEGGRIVEAACWAHAADRPKAKVK
jgi:hypothetical protein